jgi:hypothetical protein
VILEAALPTGRKAAGRNTESISICRRATSSSAWGLLLGGRLTSEAHNVLRGQA